MVLHLLLFYPPPLLFYSYSHRIPVLFDRGAFVREPVVAQLAGLVSPVRQAEVSVDVRLADSVRQNHLTCSMQPHVSSRIT